ncbi:MAG: LacI family DNA-binding transcriptional regulator, partial [Anaerolineaceae bacterium]|nr:LacI family DNA-binding transcriptional regulator [Anaerolineaceae bacterium]
MAVTMKDVARQAGVSIRTVSRAINGLDDVSIETRQKILAVARELGFRPSQLARALVTRRSQTLGLVIPHITNPYFAEVAHGVFNTAKESGYSVLLNNCSYFPEPDLNSWYTLADRAVEGLITDLLYGHESDILN